MASLRMSAWEATIEFALTLSQNIAVSFKRMFLIAEYTPHNLHRTDHMKNGTKKHGQNIIVRIDY